MIVVAGRDTALSAADQTPIDEGCTCGFDGDAVPVGDLAVALVDSARRWSEFLDAVTDYPGGVDDLCVRPDRDDAVSWSAIEYACHVRDVVSVFTRRTELTLLSHNPAHQRWDGDQAARDDHYRAQHPAAVAEDVVRGARELADLVQPLAPPAWDRPCELGGRSSTVADLVRQTLHELRHHLDDARAVVPAPTA